MSIMARVNSDIDTGKYRLRRFVEHLIELGEVEVHDEPVPLTGLSTIIEATSKAVLFKQAGPERVELVAKTAGNRRRLAAAFGTTEDKLYDAYYRRLANPQPVVEIPSGAAPVHEFVLAGRDVDLSRLPFHPQHAYDGSCYLSAAMDFTDDPATGRRKSAAGGSACATAMKPAPTSPLRRT
jgi:UbiD family decarboxylase